MKIIVQCPKCGSRWVLEEQAADRRKHCQKCGKMFKVPTLEEVSKAAELIGLAKTTVYVDSKGKIYG